MSLSVRGTEFSLPKYTVTGDILAYRTCGLQYRYYGRGALPSMSGDLWFGHFIHGVMEEAFGYWRDGRMDEPPWEWEADIREIELAVAKRLRGQGLYPPPTLFDRNEKGGEKLLASRRAEAAINVWGQWLFPLIDNAEVRLHGIRPMPDDAGRAKHYEISGVADVIPSFKIDAGSSDNPLVRHLRQNDEVRLLLDRRKGDAFEIVVDYKGMRRPGRVVAHKRSPRFSEPVRDWDDHETQVLTYAWLRSLQPDSAPVVAGVLLYLNELVPSRGDVDYLKDEVAMGATDLPARGASLAEVVRWQEGKTDRPPGILKARSIRVVPVTRLKEKLARFDRVVARIERSVSDESSGKPITESWEAFPQLRTCGRCDFRSHCPESANHGPPTV